MLIKVQHAGIVGIVVVVAIGLLWSIAGRALERDALQAAPASGSNLTFESWKGFPSGSLHASLAHANRNFHFSQAR